MFNLTVTFVWKVVRTACTKPKCDTGFFPFSIRKRIKDVMSNGTKRKTSHFLYDWNLLLFVLKKYTKIF